MPYSQAMAEIESLKNQMYEEFDWKKRDEIEKRMYSVIRGIVPEVGIPCTIVYFSDYRAATVVDVNEKKTRVGVKFNRTICEDYYGGQYEVLPELYGRVQFFTHRRNGQWVMEGQPVSDGVVLALHYQSHYIDPHY